MPYAATILTSATVEPTDRSRPAVSTTNVWPNDTAASAAAATPMFLKFCVVRNTAEVSQNIAIRRMTTAGRPISRPYLRARSVMCSRRAVRATSMREESRIIVAHPNLRRGSRGSNKSFGQRSRDSNMRCESRIQNAAIVELVGVHLVGYTAPGHGHNAVAESDQPHDFRRHRDPRAAGACQLAG